MSPSTLSSHFREILGGTVLAVRKLRRDENSAIFGCGAEDGGYAFIIKNGDKAFVLVPMRDEEGNGPGAAFVCPIEKAPA